MTYDSKQIALQHICNIYAYNDVVDLRNVKNDKYVIYSCQVINDSNAIIIANTFADVKAYVEQCCPGTTWSNKIVFGNNELPPTHRGVSCYVGMMQNQVLLLTKIPNTVRTIKFLKLNL